MKLQVSLDSSSFFARDDATADVASDKDAVAVTIVVMDAIATRRRMEKMAAFRGPRPPSRGRAACVLLLLCSR